MSARLFAVIKRSSKYAHQQPKYPDGKAARPFAVSVGLGNVADYVVSGNGNQYRVRDLNFFVLRDDGSFVRLG